MHCRVRSVLQRGLGRPVSLDEVASFTIGSLRSDDGEDTVVAVAEAKKATEIAVVEAVAQKLEESDRCAHRLIHDYLDAVVVTDHFVISAVRY